MTAPIECASCGSTMPPDAKGWECDFGSDFGLSDSHYCPPCVEDRQSRDTEPAFYNPECFDL